MFAARKNGIKELDLFHLMATSIYSISLLFGGKYYVDLVFPLL